jgi:hypothetical protein
MKMKKHNVLTGLVSVLLMAGLMFSACPTEGDGGGGGGLSAPGPGDLPSLPADSGIAYVTNTEATALLSTLSTGFSSVQNAVENIVETAAEAAVTDSPNFSFEVRDNTTIANLKINARGSSSLSSNVPAENQIEDYEPKPGDWVKNAYNSYIAVDFTGDKTESGLTVYQGSTVKAEEEESSDITVKANTFGVKISYKEVYAYGLTVSSGGKGGKIVLDAKAAGALSGEYTDPEEMEGSDTPIIYTGSLTVYGAADAEVYKLNIINEATYDQALGYFAYSVQDSPD